jgi:hypothetical protein
MKTHFLSFTVLFGLIAGVFAEEATKPSVSITAKRQTLDASHDRGAHSESSDKEVTLRVEIRNVTNETLEGAELTGEVIINRSKNGKIAPLKRLWSNGRWFVKKVRPTLAKTSAIRITLGF